MAGAYEYALSISEKAHLKLLAVSAGTETWARNESHLAFCPSAFYFKKRNHMNLWLFNK